MTITHAKVSGLVNEDPAKVGGEDWDDPHVVSGPECVAFVKVFSDGDTQSANKWPSGIAVYWYPTGSYQVDIPGANFVDASAAIGAQYVPEVSIYGRSSAGDFAEVAPLGAGSPQSLMVNTYNGSYVAAENFDFFVLKVWKINP
jgi:hypothetical protein